jgi:universal stress protein A
MGTHGRTGLPHVLLGSVAEKVVRLAPCPVLTVRESTDEGHGGTGSAREVRLS